MLRHLRQRLPAAREREAAHWSRRAEEWDRLYDDTVWLNRIIRRPLRLRHEAVLNAVRSLDGPSVCDVGCGTGRQLAAAIGEGASRGVGIDLSAEMARLAATRWERLGIRDRLTIQVGDALHWEPDQTFDVVWALGVFDYVADPVPLLHKMASLSRGVILATFRRIWAFRSPLRKLAYHLRGQPIYLYTRSQVRHACETAGLKDVSVERLDGTCYLARGRR